MASAPQIPEKLDTLIIREASHNTERYWISPTRPLDFGPPDEPDLLDVPEGISSLTVQARRCGDCYAEVSGAPPLCRSAVAPTLKGAVAAAFAQVSQ